MSPSQFEGSAEKLLVNDMTGEGSSPSPHFYSTFGSSSGRNSPCSTPTPPPYNRNRQPAPAQNTVSPQVMAIFLYVMFSKILFTVKIGFISATFSKKKPRLLRNRTKCEKYIK